MKSRNTANSGIDWGKALGAARGVPLSNLTITTPIDVLALREEVLTRIRSAGEVGPRIRVGP